MQRLARLADPYIALLLGTVALAVLLPASGRAASGLDWATTIAVGLIFFLYGARLSPREAVDGLRHWRLHLAVVCATFVLFPLLGLASHFLVPYALAPELHSGLLFLCLVPSTIQSSIAFTSIARGNVPAAICAGTYSSLLGMLATPLLVAWLIGGQAALSPDGLTKIAGQLLAPFIAGQLLRRWIGAFLTRHKRITSFVDRGSVLLVVYTAFSQGMVQGIWGQVTPLRLLELLGVEAVLLAVMLSATWYGGGRLGFDTADRIVITFAGSKKSLAAGLPMASVLFGTRASLAVLPLMLFHQMQLIVCAYLARRLAERAQPETEGDGEGGKGAAAGEGGRRGDGRAATARAGTGTATGGGDSFARTP